MLFFKKDFKSKIIFIKTFKNKIIFFILKDFFIIKSNKIIKHIALYYSGISKYFKFKKKA